MISFWVKEAKNSQKATHPNKHLRNKVTDNLQKFTKPNKAVWFISSAIIYKWRKLGTVVKLHRSDQN